MKLYFSTHVQKWTYIQYITAYSLWSWDSHEGTWQVFLESQYVVKEEVSEIQGLKYTTHIMKVYVLMIVGVFCPSFSILPPMVWVSYSLEWICHCWDVISFSKQT